MQQDHPDERDRDKDVNGEKQDYHRLYLFTLCAADQNRDLPRRAALRNRPEIVGVQAGAADERAVHLSEAEDRIRILRVDRAAIKDASARWYAVAHRGVRRGDVFHRRGQPGTDRPDRLVRDDEAGWGSAVGDRTCELRRDDFDLLSGLALTLRPSCKRSMSTRSSPTSG